MSDEKDYTGSFFMPKPRHDGRTCGHVDIPCHRESFLCTERWWNDNIKSWIDTIESEYGMKATVTEDQEPPERVESATVRIDGNFVATCRTKEEVSVALISAYSTIQNCKE